MGELTTHKIKGVEVFAAGTWNGDKYTVEDLDAMVAAFSQTNRTWRPYLKLGHDDKQQILQNDGYPVAGWVTNLYRVGDKLLADFSDVPDKLYKLMMARAYNRVSCEIYWNIKINEFNYPRFLSAIALLGSDMPAVQSLNDIISYYGLDWMNVVEDKKVYDNLKSAGTVKTYNIDLVTKVEEEMPAENTVELTKLQEEAQALREQNEKLSTDLKKLTADFEAKSEQDKELETLKQFRIDAEKRFKEDAERIQKAQTEADLADLLKENLITPAMKPFVAAILGDEKKEYSLTIADKEQKLSKFELLKETLKLSSALKVNTKEQTESGKETKGGDEALLDEVRKYAADKKLSHADAYKAVMRAKQQA